METRRKDDKESVKKEVLSNLAEDALGGIPIVAAGHPALAGEGQVRHLAGPSWNLTHCAFSYAT